MWHVNLFVKERNKAGKSVSGLTGKREMAIAGA